MPIVTVESLEDPRIADYRELNSRNLWRTDRKFIVEGKTLVERLLASRVATTSILTSADLAAELHRRASADVPIYVVPRPDISRIVGFRFHRGALACGIRPAAIDLQTALRDAPAEAVVVICPQTLDPTNLGSILRNCQAFGVTAVLLGARCADPFSRRVVRVSMGAALRLPIIESQDLVGDMGLLRDSWDFELAAAVLDDADEELPAAVRPKRLALVFGTEADEVNPTWLAACERRLTLPMRSGADSLNVATATGVFLYHFTRVAATTGL